jgi:Uma2 family endonuclease
VKLTYQDYCRIPEDGKRHEILDGEHHVSPAPSTDHQSVLGHLHARLYAAVQDPGLGRVFIAPTDLQLSEVDIVQPDLMVILQKHLHIITPTKVKGIPDLVIEILSPSTTSHDRQAKKERYRIAGVPEYWIVDPDEHVVEQYLLEGGAYRLAGLRETELSPANLPNVRIDIPRLWSPTGR